MKKGLFSLALGLCLLACSMTTAFAANDTSYTTQVSYTKEEPETYTYSLYIDPSVTISQNGSSYSGVINVRPDNVELPAQKRLVVTLADNTFTDSGNFYLYKDKGTENEARLACSIHAQNNTLHAGDMVVAFANGSTMPTAVEFYLSSSAVETAPAGTYTGTVYFSAAVIDK